MTSSFIYDELNKISGGVLKNEPMSRHTTFKIGGEADFLVQPSTVSEVCCCVKFLRKEKIPFAVIGNGSNLLVSDNGFRGVIIKLLKNFSQIREEDGLICAQAGATLSSLAAFAAERGLEGLQFASGIPGTVGGAVLMNAGAYGGQMSDVVVRTKYIDKSSEIQTAEEHGFSYRSSVFQKNGGIILETAMKLQHGNRDEIYEKMRSLAEARREKQPLNFPSAGSAFKRPEGFFAAKLIDDAGLRGFTVGGAKISEKHTGFVINRGGATQKDVSELMQKVSDTVYEKFGVRLEREIKFLGD